MVPRPALRAMRPAAVFSVSPANSLPPEAEPSVSPAMAMAAGLGRGAEVRSAELRDA
jgi:hypothetical protein